MTFTVYVDFFGIFGIVPHDGAPEKLAFVLPATDYPYDPPACEVEVTCTPGYGLVPTPRPMRVALDGKPLERHRWFVDYDPSQLVCEADDPENCPDCACVVNPPPPGNHAQWVVSAPDAFRRMTFDAPGAPALTIANGLDYVANMGEVAANFGRMNPAYLGWPAATEVGGQIMFDRGELVPPPPNEVTDWVFPPSLRLPIAPTYQYVVSLAHRVRLRLADVSSFTIETRDTQGGHVLESLTLQPTAALPEVQVTICNLCYLNPLRWPPHPGRRVDDDFRWLYELCDNKAQITVDLWGLDLPVPHPSGEPGGLGQNCLEGQFTPAPFEID